MYNDIKEKKVYYWGHKKGLDEHDMEDALQEAYLKHLEGDPNPEGNAVGVIGSQKHQAARQKLNQANNYHSINSVNNKRGTYDQDDHSYVLARTYDLDEPEIIEIIKQWDGQPTNVSNTSRHHTSVRHNKINIDELLQVCNLIAYNSWDSQNRKSNCWIDGKTLSGREHLGRNRKIAEELGYKSGNTTVRRIKKIREILEERGYEPNPVS